ncbi:MAG: TRAP transporter small permease [Rhodocyclaceae bacterium]|jgi:TRAP-type C4-dicarboxylate transport system permease small subunit|nr:TRAP transporter small permease [Rhodocyclaceae bacterium]
MSHGYDPRLPAANGPAPGALDRAMALVNRALLVPCMLALLAAAGILTYSVAARYFFKIATDWQDEAAVFLLVGATFLSGAYLQSQRGHIGIEALAGVLPARVNLWRLLLVDIASSAFCLFFAWKSWTLFHEAWAEGQTTSSSWGPPLWIPYGVMAAGMTLVGIQLLLHVMARIRAVRTAP